MSIGPIYGRKDNRRGNNSYLGGFEFHHAIKLGTSAAGVSVYTATLSSTQGVADHGIKRLQDHHAAVIHSMYFPPYAGLNWNGASTVDHRVYNAGADNSLRNSETFGGGSTSQTRGARYGLNYANQYDSGHKPQSAYPYIKYIHTLNDAHMARVDQMARYFGTGTQGHQDHDSLHAMWYYRQIIALTYTCGGYKSSDPWKTVHRSNHATDQTSNLGAIMDYDGNYISGGCNSTTAFVWSTPTDNAANTASTRTSAVHMYTETGKSHNSTYDMYDARQDLATAQDNVTFAFVSGGPGPNTNVYAWNLVTECRQQSISAAGGGMSGGTGAGAFDDKNYSYFWDDDNGAKWNKQTWALASATHWASHGQQKGITSGQRKGWCGNEGSYNGGYHYRRWNLTNDTNTGNVGKILTNMGEENYGRGMDFEYMIGDYDGEQNNETHKFYYSTNTGTANVSGLAPTAHAGQSSGHCMWRS